MSGRNTKACIECTRTRISISNRLIRTGYRLNQRLTHDLTPDSPVLTNLARLDHADVGIMASSGSHPSWLGLIRHGWSSSVMARPRLMARPVLWLGPASYNVVLATNGPGLINTGPGTIPVHTRTDPSLYVHPAPPCRTADLTAALVPAAMLPTNSAVLTGIWSNNGSVSAKSDRLVEGRQL